MPLKGAIGTEVRILPAMLAMGRPCHFNHPPARATPQVFQQVSVEIDAPGGMTVLRPFWLGRAILYV